MPSDPVPHIRFLCSAPNGPRELRHRELDAPVPLSREDILGNATSRITYRAYLEAVKQTLVENLDRLERARRELEHASHDPIQQIDIITEKHGSDYHPARIEVRTADTTASFVMNVAITERGKARARTEFQILQHMAQRFKRGFAPNTYFFAERSYTAGTSEDDKMIMFLGDWFDDYHEFHLSAKRTSRGPQMILWDMNQGHRFLSDEESKEIFRQAAFILTYYYDMKTLQEIFPWHHASGDFVAACSDAMTDVRLITVRQYERRMVFEQDSAENRMTALLLFFVNLTLRMRLDRLDGVGDTAWAPDLCARATVEGFIDALNEKIAEASCDPSLIRLFLERLRGISPTDLAEVFGSVVDSYDQDAPDVAIIRDHLGDHVLEVWKLIKTDVKQYYSPRTLTLLHPG